MSARERILERIRVSRLAGGVPEHGNPARSGQQVHPRPRVAADLIAVFRDNALKLSTTISTAESMHAVPAVAAEYLRSHGLTFNAVCWQDLAALDWPACGMQVEARAARDSDLVGITGVACAIAETGTLMVTSGARTPATASLLPETHIAVVRCSQIVPAMEEAWKLLRPDGVDGMPRAVNFISGPSRTADIEQTVTLGAHGPYRVHVILIDG